MGFWHTGYFEFHEPAGLGVVFRPSKIYYPCQACDARFEDPAALRQHRLEAHRFERPLMFIRGLELGATPLRITQPLAVADVQTLRAERALLNGHALSLSKLSSELCQVPKGKVVVTLANAQVEAKFELDFQVAQLADMEGVERAFLDMARGRELSIRAIDGFIAATKAYRSAALYADGLCHYLYGVLAKQRSADSGLPYSEYSNRYTRAADELLGFERPLAEVVRAAVAFHFNHFDDAQAWAPQGRIQRAAYLFGGVLSGWPWHLTHEDTDEGVGPLEDLLTDFETLRILRWAELGAQELEAVLPEMEAQLRRDIPEYDRLKLLVMVAEAKAAAGDVAGAKAAARQLAGIAKTAEWAAALISRFDGSA